MLIFFGYNFFGKKKLGIKISENLELVKSYQIFFFMIPLFFQKRIMGYDFLKKKYYEFDDKLGDRLLKLGRETGIEQLNQVIKKYEKEEKEKVECYQLHKEDIEKRENQDFMKFLREIGIFFLILILVIIIKEIFF